MKIIKISMLVSFLVVALFLAFYQTQCFAYTINHWIQSENVANVIYTENNAGDVDISFSGIFDFTSIGGNMEAFSGNFLYSSDAPFAQITDINGVEHAFYSATPINFTMFGTQLNPIASTIYLSDGFGIYSDLLFFQVTLDYYNGLGIQIPNTSEGLISIGLNAGIYPNDLLTNTEVPRNLNVMQANIGNVSFWAELSDVQPVPEPKSIFLLCIGLIGLAGAAVRCESNKKTVGKVST